ncbi:unnamed protein product [Amoebophrya sp. A25]|nr:unnamed protein product [Amoebophrya sp. A25]|eukprot:GSA25T00019698001.1
MMAALRGPAERRHDQGRKTEGTPLPRALEKTTDQRGLEISMDEVVTWKRRDMIVKIRSMMSIPPEEEAATFIAEGQSRSIVQETTIEEPTMAVDVVSIQEKKPGRDESMVVDTKTVAETTQI